MATRPAPAGAADTERIERAGRGLLLRAIALPPREARAAWQEWRASADVGRLDGAAFHMLPVLGGRLAGWLEGDPAAGVLHGIVRRAWTETQLRLRAFRSLAALLEQAGCGPVLAGASAAVCLLNRLPDSVRPVSDIRMVIPRGRLARAAAVLEQAGWRRSGELPEAEALDRAAAVHFSRHGMHLLLQWRFLDVAPALAAAVEQEFPAHRQRVACGGFSVWTPGPEHALLAALCGRLEFDLDPVPWQVDAALLPLDRVAWRRWRALAERFAPQAFERLEEMRALGLAAPAMRRRAPRRPSRLRALYGKWRGRGGRVARRLLRKLRPW